MRPARKRLATILLAAYSVGLTHGAIRSYTTIPRLVSMKGKAETEKNPIAQRLITAMEKPPHLTPEDVEALRQLIEEGKIPVKFDSPLEPDERQKQ